MNIQEEYQKLTELSQTKEGWSTVEKAWSVATSKTQEKIPWYENPINFVTESKGDKVEGFAIDSKTKKVFTGTYQDHSYAYGKLYDHLLKNEDTPDCNDIEYRIIKGWRGLILDFQNPCIFIVDHRFFTEPDFLKEIEESILEQELGLPLSGLFVKRLFK